MEGDPSIPYIVDAWIARLRDFDEQTACEAMRKGATTRESSTCFVRTRTIISARAMFLA